VHHSLTSTYIPRFTEIKETFCGRTYLRTVFPLIEAGSHIQAGSVIQAGGQTSFVPIEAESLIEAGGGGSDTIVLIEAGGFY